MFAGHQERSAEILQVYGSHFITGPRIKPREVHVRQCGEVLVPVAAGEQSCKVAGMLDALGRSDRVEDRKSCAFSGLIQLAANGHCQAFQPEQFGIARFGCQQPFNVCEG